MLNNAQIDGVGSLHPSAQDVERSLVIDESSALCVPRSEYLIEVLLCLGEGPWHFWYCILPSS